MEECIRDYQRENSKNLLHKPESSHYNLHSDMLSKEEKTMLVNCGTKMTVWKDHNCLLTSMPQTNVRGELFRDLRWSYMTCVDTHVPEKHASDSLHHMMGFTEQDYREGKVVITKKKVRVIQRHKELMLCGTHWIVCNIIMTLCQDDVTCDFSHDVDKVFPAWYA